MLDHRQKKDLKKRLRFITGQLEAIERMVEEDHDAAAIHVQLQSVQSALTRSVMGTFETEHRRALAAEIVERQQRCPGPSCQVCDMVCTIQRDFPNLTIKQVLDHLGELRKSDPPPVEATRHT